jgi:cation diffusion facilitator CzcD-associated flavoprotein CzcO
MKLNICPDCPGPQFQPNANHALPESYIYRFSWDKEDLQSYPWANHYSKQADVLAYLNHVANKYDLKKHMQFNTELRSAEWDEEKNIWRIEVSTGETFTSRYLITALGLLSKQNYPDIKGIDKYKGEIHHTAKWPQGYDLTGKRAGVIGCGSTGVQVITDIAKRVQSLTCFQRHPQYSVPSGDGPVDPKYREYVNNNYDAIWDQVRNSAVAFGFKESTIPAMSVSPEERERIFEENWQKGNGTFSTHCHRNIKQYLELIKCGRVSIHVWHLL